MKKRLDILLVEKNLLPAREKAKAAVMAGIVYVDGQKADKPGTDTDENSLIEVRGNNLRYVSRGGLKLEKAIDRFNISLAGLYCADIGASTGGFSDCMLQNGAARVWAIDVGYGQLAWTLRNDPRVVVLERTNIRYVTDEQIGTSLDFLSIDVSFISLKLVLPAVYSLLKEGGEVVCLIKPQFEAGREKVGKKGVVREAATHFEVVRKITAFAEQNGFQPLALDFSPIRGPEGNIEYLLHLRKNGASGLLTDEYISDVIAKSHENLEKT